MIYRDKLPCWCYLWLYLSSTHWYHSSSPGLGTWRSFRLLDSTYMSLLSGISCCHLLVLSAWSWVLFDTKLCLGGVRGIGSYGGEFIFSKGFCALLSSWPFVFHELLGCYICAWGWGMVSLPAGWLWHWACSTPWLPLGCRPLPRKGSRETTEVMSLKNRCLEFTLPSPWCPSALPPLRSPQSQAAAC